jgi:hypothetical protein
METREDDLGTPRMEDLEDDLARNYVQFDALRHEWGREWQRAMVRRAHRRAKERAAQMKSDTQQPLDAA